MQMVKRDDDGVKDERSLHAHCLKYVAQDCDVVNQQSGSSVRQGDREEVTGAREEIATEVDHEFF